MKRLRIVADEATDVPQSGIGQQFLDGHGVNLEAPALIVVADVVAILATTDTMDDARDYALAVLLRLARFYGLHPVL